MSAAARIPEKILIVLPTWVGDAVMATPTLAAVRRTFPKAHVAWLGGKTALDVLAGLPWADETLEDPSKGGSIGGIFAAGKLLRARRFDVGILLSNSFRVAAVCRLGRVKKLVGYARDGRTFLLQEKLYPPRREDGRFAPTPAIGYYLKLAERLGCDVSDAAMHLAVEPHFTQQAEELFREAGISGDKPVVLLNPGASFGASKLYPAEKFAEVGDALCEKFGAQIILNAAPREQAIAAAVAGAMRHKPLINLAERHNTLGLLKAVTARCTLMITNDTGPRHIAAALGVGVVTIFGPTDPQWTVINYARERMVRVAVPCSPCQKKVCPLPPGESHHQCMKRLPSAMVIAAAEELLAKESVR